MTTATRHRPRLVLVGGGHSHLEILGRLIEHSRGRFEVTLVSLEAHHVYSGMLPGFVAGCYQRHQLSFDLQQLTRAAGGFFVRDRAVRLDPGAQRLHFSSGDSLEYDWISFNVGSRLLGDKQERIRDNALIVKPLTRVERVPQALSRLVAASKLPQVVVVGGGAAGVEMAFACRRFLDDNGSTSDSSVTVVDAAAEILGGYTGPFRERARQVLAARSIGVGTGAAVDSVAEDHLLLQDGETIPSDLTIWLTGPASIPLFHDSGLPIDSKGFLLVDDSLRSVGDSRVFGVGDCATLANYPETPKAGVYAVRQGPLLWEALQASVSGQSLPRYRPQNDFLSILNSCDGKALLQYKGWTSYSRAGWLLKDWIDRRFMRRYHRLYR